MRTIADLPWRGTPVALRWQVRRFFCDEVQCPRRIFAERLDQVAPGRGRSTRRLNETLGAIGLECGGEPGRRLSAELGIRTSGDTILRRVRATPLHVELKPSSIGIDDFALRKGHRYGTVVVDHESHRVVDLLPERSSDSTARWLALQPQVEVVTRDRSALYAKGITAANPNVIQVADRFHLYANLREALVRLLDRHHREISAAAKAVAESKPQAPEPPVLPPPQEVDTPPTEPFGSAAVPLDPPRLSKAMSLSSERRARRLLRYEQVVELGSSGMSLRAISRKLGIGRDSVTRFLRAGSFPERAKTRRWRAMNPVVDELR